MANISYTVTRWDVSVHPEGRDDAGHVCKVILGVTATDSVSGFSSYKDESISVHSCMPLDQFTDGAAQFIENTLGTQGWYLDLQTRIASQMTSPVEAPAHDKPDFGSMTIGDGYQDLPSEEAEAEEAPAEEEVAAEEEAPAEGE